MVVPVLFAHSVVTTRVSSPRNIPCNNRGDYSPNVSKAECEHALKGLALPGASHSSEIALASSRHLCSTLAAVPVLFGHAVVLEIEIGRIITPSAPRAPHSPQDNQNIPDTASAMMARDLNLFKGFDTLIASFGMAVADDAAIKDVPVVRLAC